MKLEKELEKEFKRELKELLQKYNMTIGFSVSPDSDVWGIFGETTIAYPNDTDDQEIILAEDWGVSANDL